MDLNLLKETAMIQLLESKAELEFPAAELRIEKIGKCTDCRGCSVNQLQEDAEEAARPDDEDRDRALQVARGRVGRDETGPVEGD